MKGRAVFLDRDGVLVRAYERRGGVWGPLALDEFELLPGIAEPVRRLRDAGYWIVLATNQPSIARGLLSKPVLEEMHRRLCDALPIDLIQVCPHSDEDACGCRKPKPGMILDAAARLQLDLGRCWFIGDTSRDMEAAAAAGVRSILLSAPYNRETAGIFRAPDLEAAAELILAHGS